MTSGESIQPLKSLAAPASLAELIARHYVLPDPRCRLIKSTMRDTYLVTAGSTRAVAVIYRHGSASVDAIEAEIALLDRIAEAGLTVPRAFRTASGRGIVRVRYPEGERYLVLFSFVDGSMLPRAAEPELAGDVGATLARLHVAFEQCTGDLSRPRQDLTGLIDESLLTLTRFLPATDPNLARLNAIAGYCREQLAGLPTDAPGFGLIHGDVIPSNMLVQPEGDLALLDFDLCGYGWRAYDIASYLHELEFWGATAASHAAFLAAYERERPLADWERQAFGPFQAARALVALAIPAAYVNEWGTSALPDSLLGRLIELAERHIG